MPKKTLCTGFLYAHDSWDEYWEGTLKRANGNIGTVTTQSVAWMGTYGITDRLNAIAMLPYVWTGASQGVLQGQSGFQDLSVALKFKLLETPFTSAGSLRAILAATAGTPLATTRPTSSRSRSGSRAAALGRATLYFQAKSGFFVNAHGRLHLARQRHARPPGVLHGRRAAPERRGADARRVRLQREHRLHQGPPAGADLVLAADHARGRRHPAAGHAVRLEPDEPLAPRRRRPVRAAMGQGPVGPARGGLHRERPQRRPGARPSAPASCTPSISSERHRHEDRDHETPGGLRRSPQPLSPPPWRLPWSPPAAAASRRSRSSSRRPRTATTPARATGR